MRRACVAIADQLLESAFGQVRGGFFARLVRAAVARVGAAVRVAVRRAAALPYCG